MSNELPSRKTVRHPHADYNGRGAFFLTVCTQNRRPILSRIVGTGVPDGPHTELLPYGKVAEKYIQQLHNFYNDVSVESYVIMPNHIHLLLFVRPNDDGPSGTPVPTPQNTRIARFVSTFKRFCNKEYGENIWQTRSFDHVIRDRRDFDEHLRYIYENPAQWEFDELHQP